MEKKTLYTITENGECRNYVADDDGTLDSLGKLLHRTEKIRANLPRGSRLSVLEAMNRQYNFIAIRSKNSLLHPIHENEAAEIISRIEAAVSQDVHIKVDYDADRLAFLYEHKGEVHQITAPVTAFTEAYSGSIRKKNAYQTYVNYNHFAKQLENICEGQCLSSPAEQPGEDETQSPKMSL